MSSEKIASDGQQTAGYNSEKMMAQQSPSRSSHADAESLNKSLPPDLKRKLKSRHLQMIAIGMKSYPAN